jgi:hypothetical protein
MQKVEGSNPFSHFADQALQGLKQRLDGPVHLGPNAPADCSDRWGVSLANGHLWTPAPRDCLHEAE